MCIYTRRVFLEESRSCHFPSTKKGGTLTFPDELFFDALLLLLLLSLSLDFFFLSWSDFSSPFFLELVFFFS
jgi:hypothetical protein